MASRAAMPLGPTSAAESAPLSSSLPQARTGGEGTRRDSAPQRGGSAGASPASRLAVLAGVVALHGLILALLFSPSEPLPVAPPQVPTLLVSLLAPEPPASRPTTPPAAPQPVQIQRPAPAPRPQPPARPQPAPSTHPAPAAEQPTNAISEAPPASPPATAAGASEAAPTPPPSPPRFDAAYLHNQTPYPPLARRLRESGTVRLRVLVSAQGEAEKVEILTSSGSPRLDEGAQEAVRRWRFIPARQGDQPVHSYVVVPIIYKLEES